MKNGNIVLNLASYASKIVPSSLKNHIYKSTLLSKLIRRSLNYFAPQGINLVEVAAGTNEGLEMLIDLQTEKDYWLGTYELKLQQVIEILIKPGQIIYDIGANIGFFTLMFARKVGRTGHVYSFEALPENINRLQKNIEANGYLDRVTVVHAAVQDRSGQANFLIGPSHATGKVHGSAGRDAHEYREEIMIAGLAIDDFIENPMNLVPDIMKLDIEGGEILAFAGMTQLLQRKHPIMLIELHGFESAKKCWQQLTLAGYRICRMEVDFPEVVNYKDLDWKSYIAAFPYEQ